MAKVVDAIAGNVAERFQNFIRQFQKDNAKSARRDMAAAQRFAELEADLGFLAMLNVAMLRLLSDKGMLKDGELMDRLEMADKLDGVEDGALSMSAFRSLVGVPRGKKATPAPTPARLATSGTKKFVTPSNGKAAAKLNAAKLLKAKGKTKAKGRK